MNIFTGIQSFFKEVNAEMKKVSWPTTKETFQDTMTVIGFSITVAIFLGGLDLGFTKILNIFIH